MTRLIPAAIDTSPMATKLLCSLSLLDDDWFVFQHLLYQTYLAVHPTLGSCMIHCNEEHETLEDLNISDLNEIMTAKVQDFYTTNGIDLPVNILYIVKDDIEIPYKYLNIKNIFKINEAILFDNNKDFDVDALETLLNHPESRARKDVENTEKKTSGNINSHDAEALEPLIPENIDPHEEILESLISENKGESVVFVEEKEIIPVLLETETIPKDVLEVEPTKEIAVIQKGVITPIFPQQNVLPEKIGDHTKETGSAPININETVQMMLLACIESACDGKDIYVAGRQIQPEDIITSDMLLPAILITASESWGLVVKDNKGGFHVNLQKDDESLLGYSVKGLAVSSLMTLFIPFTSIIRGSFANDFVNLDFMVAKFSRWLKTHNFDRTLINNIDLRIVRPRNEKNEQE